jgi:hypothetical protein
MKYRILFIGDHFWGIEPCVGDLLADTLLVQHPRLPLEFSIQSSPRNTFDALFTNCPRDIIGRQAETTLLCVGWEDAKGILSANQCVEGLEKLLHEIRRNSQTKIVACTIPTIQLQEDSLTRAKLTACNQYLLALPQDEWLQVADLDSAFNLYQAEQSVRGDLARNLFTDSGTLGQLGKMLCVHVLMRNMKFSA